MFEKNYQEILHSRNIAFDICDVFWTPHVRWILDHLFSTYAQFSEELIFRFSWYTHVCTDFRTMNTFSFIIFSHSPEEKFQLYFFSSKCDKIANFFLISH